MSAAVASPNGTIPSAARSPIFAKPIPIIGVTGEFESGKTRFMLSLAPGPDTLVFDTEDSVATYAEVGAKRIDIPAEMLKAHPNGYKPIDVFTWWHQTVKMIPPGKFRVIALDVAEDIEAGLADWVMEHPTHFNHTRAQYLKMSGMYWGDVKAMWKPLLLDLRARCEIFVFGVHLGSVWGDNKPTGAKKPKGKSTLMELATLFLHLERPVAADGSKPEVPSARVLKTRLSHNIIDASGELVTKAILPPRMPRCTRAAIREYIARPADFSALTADERTPTVMMTDDERAAVRLATAQAETEAARLRLEVMEAERRGGGPSPATVTTAAAEDAALAEAADSLAVDPVDLPARGSDGETLQEALATHAPSDQSKSIHAVGGDAPAAISEPPPPTTPVESDPPAPYVRPRSLPLDPSQSIRSLWEEHAHLNGMTCEQKNDAFAAILKKFGAAKTSELKPDAVAAIEEKLVTTIRSTYQARGMSSASPF